MKDFEKFIDGFRNFRRFYFDAENDYYTSLNKGQHPKAIVIACSDSRADPALLMGCDPGDIFVVRNVANLVPHADDALRRDAVLAVLEYGVHHLKVEHIIVLGHSGCGGVLAALQGTRVGLADNWIRHVTDVRDRHRDLIAATAPEWRHDVLCELNAIEQVVNIAQTTVMLDAWGRGQKVTLHGWCYGLKDGLINNLHMSVDSTEGLESLYKAAIAGVAATRRQ